MKGFEAVFLVARGIRKAGVKWKGFEDAVLGFNRGWLWFGIGFMVVFFRGPPLRWEIFFDVSSPKERFRFFKSQEVTCCIGNLLHIPRPFYQFSYLAVVSLVSALDLPISNVMEIRWLVGTLFASPTCSLDSYAKLLFSNWACV